MEIGRIVLLGVLLALVGYVGMGVLLYVLQSHLVYVPQRKMVATPEDIALAYQDVVFTSADGVRLSGWWLPGEKPRGVVLFCHGNGGNISHLLERIRVFHDLGLSTFVFDYRGYGLSEGAPTEQGTYLDAEAAWNYLVREQGVEAGEILVYGWSLGGPIATWLAQRHTPAKLVLESTFTSIPDLGQDLYPLFPARLLSRYEYNTLDCLSRVSCPLLVVHSLEDDLIPFAHGRRLYEAARGPRKFLEIAGEHGDGFMWSAEPYKEALDGFISL